MDGVYTLISVNSYSFNTQTREVAVRDQVQEASTDNAALTIVVLGASGDLAKKKTYPVLFALYLHGLLPSNAIIYGYARSKIDLPEFRAQISQQ